MPRDGLAIAIAWPKYRGKQMCAWYDPIMRWIGLNRNYYYQVGHASLVLVDEAGNCFYFDCGRFHTPFRKGRIRDAGTDTELTINTKAHFFKGELTNLVDILKEIQLNKGTKCTGPLEAASCPINFKAALKIVKEIQNKEIFPFGPFAVEGTNCCRFVYDGILAGGPENKYNRRLRWLFPIIPMPITLVAVLEHHTRIPSREMLKEYSSVAHHFQNLFDLKLAYNKENVTGILPAPTKPSNISESAQWLGGEVYGSWFEIIKSENQYMITRYSPEGSEECRGLFQITNGVQIDLTKPFSFGYPSHCRKVTIRQENKTVKFLKFQ